MMENVNLSKSRNVSLGRIRITVRLELLIMWMAIYLMDIIC